MRSALSGQAPGYLVAIASTALMASIRMLLTPLLSDTAPFIPFVPSIMLAGAVGGLGPGLAATALGGLASAYLFLPPMESLRAAWPGHVAGLGVFLACGVVISFAAAALRSGRERFEGRNRDLRAALGERDAATRRTAVALEALAGAEQQLRSVTEAIPALVSLIGKDGRYLLVNHAYEEWFGLPRSEIVGRPVREVLGEAAWSVVGPKVEEALRGRDVHYEALVDYKRGGKRWIEASYVPNREADGSVASIVVLVTDATERKRRAREVELAKHQLQMIADVMSAPVTRCSRDLRYLWVSRPYAAFVGRPLADIVGKPIVDVLGPEGFRQIEPYVERVLAGEKVSYETLLEVPGAGSRWIQANYTPTHGQDGEVDGWVAVVLDIHERKKFETSLQLADRRKDEFLATLAHELRNPLAPIRHAVEVLREKGVSEPERTWCRNVIDRQSSHMARLLDDLLDVSRISHGKLTLSLEPRDLRPAVVEAVEATRPTIESRGHRISVVIPEVPVPVRSDHTRLVQIFMNLLSNAAKFTPRGGAIHVRVERTGEDASVIIRDTGIGFREDHRSMLFEMFSQPTPALDRSETGLGIGLALVRALVEMHGGAVSASSDGPGKGSEFAVRLPCIEAARTAEVPSPEPGRPGANGPRRVLIVDDLKDSADSLALLLRGKGHEVWTEYDGESALQAAERVRPDVVLLDVGMPGMNGYEVCRRLRAEPWARSMTLVAVTGWGSEVHRQQGDAAGFDDLLVKPVDPQTVIRLLEKRHAPDPGPAIPS